MFDSSKMRAAILQAADHIEKYPGSFDFMTGLVTGGQGCAVAWVGHFAGVREPYDQYSFHRVAHALTGAPYSADHRFYARMDAIVGSDSWRRLPEVCAGALRTYADMHFPGHSDQELAQAA